MGCRLAVLVRAIFSSSSAGLLIELWKVTKVVDIRLDRENLIAGLLPRPTFTDFKSYESSTREYDRVRVRAFTGTEIRDVCNIISTTMVLVRSVCVTTFTMPVHVHGAYFVSFLLLTGRCYDAETSVILLLLDRAFA